MPTVKTAARRADRYIRADDFAARIEGIELPPETWAVFAQLARPRSADELARQLKLDPDAVQAAVRRLVRRKLVRKHVLAWRDYAATATAAPEGHAPAAVAAPVQSRPPFYVTPAPVRAAQSRATPIISVRVAPSSPPSPAPVVNLRIASSITSSAAKSPAFASSETCAAPARPVAAGAGLRLRPVLDAIGAKAGGGVAGQLLVYRIFLKLPTELLHAAGIQSLSLVDDHYTLDHPGLRAALAETVRAHAGLDIETLAAA